MAKDISSDQTDQRQHDGFPDSVDLTNTGKQARREPPRGKLHCYDWLSDIPGAGDGFDIIEVQFKNTRKGYYRNTTSQELVIGDMVAVEASPGHDIGEVTLTGPLVAIQMKKANIKPDVELKRVFRKARHGDIEKYQESKAKENDTMIRARKIAESLNLNMKIGDVEYQGDGNKAIFYYIADERVDFRQLIKVLAETFRVRIEMKQIGARQEAGRIGGIGPCGRPLCCASWMTNFVSVGTAAARFQDISLNPQKLAGQCAKLKCCLNFEVDTYVESVKRLPSRDARLETLDSTYYFFKHDVFKREITYSTDKSMPVNLVTISADRAFEVIAMNKNGVKPESLLSDNSTESASKKPFNDILGQDITRFDKKKKKKKQKGKNQADEKADAEENTSVERHDVTPTNEKAEKTDRQRKQDLPKNDKTDKFDRSDKPDNAVRNDNRPSKPRKKKPQSDNPQSNNSYNKSKKPQHSQPNRQNPAE